MFIAFLLGQIGSVLFGAVADKAAGDLTSAATGAIRDRLARGRIDLPRNHDLEAAHRRSLRAALRYLIAGLLPLMLGRRPGRLRLRVARVVRRHSATAGYGSVDADPRLAWCHELERLAADDAWLDSWSLGTLGMEALEEIAAAEIGADAETAFGEAVLVAMRGAGPDRMPAEVEAALRQGWHASGNSGTAVVTLYRAYCLFFQDVIARDPVVAAKVGMNSRAVAITRNADLADAIAQVSVGADDVVAAVRTEVGPALAVLGDKLDALSGAVADVAVVLAEQTTAIARIEDAVGRVETAVADVAQTGGRIEGAAGRIESITGRTHEAVLELLRGRSTSAEEVADILQRYRAWLLEETTWLVTESRAASGERLRLPLSDAWLTQIPLVQRNADPRDQVRQATDAAAVFATPDALVLGGAGSGKSTIVRRFVREHAGDPTVAPPVLVRCRELRGDALAGGIDALVDHALRSWGVLSSVEIEATAAVLSAAVRSGRAVLAVDGLDEVVDGGRRVELARGLGESILRHPRLRFLVTSRDAGATLAAHTLAQLLATQDEEERAAPAGGPQGTTRGRTFDIAPLDPDHREAFITAWGRMRGLDEVAIHTGYGPLLRAVRGSGHIARLAQNVFMLSLLAQAQDQEALAGGRSLPVRRRELFLRILEYRVAGQRDIGVPITTQEIVPRLEHVALTMTRRGVVQMTEAELHVALREFDQHLDPHEYPSVVARRTVPETVAAARSLGLLVSAGPGPSRRGIPQETLQFFHLSFQEYLAGGGLAHRWCEEGTFVAELAELRSRLVADADTGVQELDPRWTETVRHAVDRVEDAQLEALWFEAPAAVEVEEVLRLWLPEPETPPAAAAALTAVALSLLSGVSELTCGASLAEEIADLAVTTFEAFDDASVFEAACRDVLASVWSDLLIARYLALDSLQGRRLRTSLVTALGPMAITPQRIDVEIGSRLELARSSDDPLARQRALMEIVEICYAGQQPVGGEERVDGVAQPWSIEGLSDATKDAVWDLAIAGLQTPAALERPLDQVTLAWVLQWATVAAQVRGDVSSYTDERAAALRALVRSSPLSGPRDPMVVAHLATLLGQTGAEVPQFALGDWTYYWAVVADGGIPLRMVSSLVVPDIDEDALWLGDLVPHYTGQAARRLAMSASRLGRVEQSLLEPMWAVFADPTNGWADRDEAFFGLVRLDSEAVNDRFLGVVREGEGAAAFVVDDFVQQRCVLGLIAIGHLPTLEELAQPWEGFDRAYMFALLGHADPRGAGVVEQMASAHPDAEHRAHAQAVLEAAVAWEALESDDDRTDD